eukprot:CAMPEP_0177461514 /NCGR_PEP_ID=MMETSP0369-20130122/15259_1 /TAXON_ID=447022 ORGANISM="Scrippsiella hangoei-like, Strain SHHI-4" /NCGR_SAMPLE_ID=MMETSP0369 /ASSEMBLY_ACC=CAM_ASM_000364 /LENGTH=647 /DNA_ID=CAMNT_0018935013 /DNA_START=26 /DNA_END=1970 /DNA_ORIENTATION=-
MASASSSAAAPWASQPARLPGSGMQGGPGVVPGGYGNAASSVPAAYFDTHMSPSFAAAPMSSAPAAVNGPLAAVCLAWATATVCFARVTTDAGSVEGPGRLPRLQRIAALRPLRRTSGVLWWHAAAAGVRWHAAAAGDDDGYGRLPAAVTQSVFAIARIPAAGPPHDAPDASSAVSGGLTIAAGWSAEDDAKHWKAQRALRDARLQVLVFFLGFIAVACATSVPAFSAVALLSDPTYVFWMGESFPTILLALSVGTTLLYTLVGVCVLRFGKQERLSDRTIAVMAALFAASLGISLLLMSSEGSEALVRASHSMGDGCSHNHAEVPQLRALLDMNSVLEELKPGCVVLKPAPQNGEKLGDVNGTGSVEECLGYEHSKYSAYLWYLEQELQCGFMCPQGNEHSDNETASLVLRHSLRAGQTIWDTKGRGRRHPHRHKKKSGHHHTAGVSALQEQVVEEGAGPQEEDHAGAIDDIMGDALEDHVDDAKDHALDHDMVVHPGDEVTLTFNEALVRKAFRDNPALEWEPAMVWMMGQPHRVVTTLGPKYGDADGAIGVRAPEGRGGSQDGIWYFPANLIKKAQLPSNKGAKKPMLFASEGSNFMVCYPLIAAQLDSSAHIVGSGLFWHGFLLILVAALTAATPLVAALKCH